MFNEKYELMLPIYYNGVRKLMSIWNEKLIGTSKSIRKLLERTKNLLMSHFIGTGSS